MREEWLTMVVDAVKRATRRGVVAENAPCSPAFLSAAAGTVATVTDSVTSVTRHVPHMADLTSKTWEWLHLE